MARLHPVEGDSEGLFNGPSSGGVKACDAAPTVVGGGGGFCFWTLAPAASKLVDISGDFGSNLRRGIDYAHPTSASASASAFELARA
jgi:hypothetical protein